jgi:hypothetical protein
MDSSHQTVLDRKQRCTIKLSFSLVDRADEHVAGDVIQAAVFGFKGRRRVVRTCPGL